MKTQKPSLVWLELLGWLHYKKKSCVLHCIPAHLSIEGYECADALAKEARNLAQPSSTIILADANAVTKYRLIYQASRKALITTFDFPRDIYIMTTLAGLRTNERK